jgi:hypothetical protein
VCSNQKIFKLAEQKIWEIAVNEKICEKIPLHSAWRNGGAQRGCKGRLWPNCQANISYAFSLQQMSPGIKLA